MGAGGALGKGWQARLVIDLAPWTPQMTGSLGTDPLRVWRARLLLGPGTMCPPEGWKAEGVQTGGH